MVKNAAPTAKQSSGEIIVEGVIKRFSQSDGTEVVALSGIDLAVSAGEFISLIGPSGCGKSTLLRLIAGLNQPEAGKLYLDDEPITGPHYERGLVFQNPMLFPWLNIHDNVAFGLQARGVYQQEKSEVANFLKLVGLADFGKSFPHQLSGGMAQRAALARALVNRPSVLLLDEPLGALDAFTRMNMQEELIRIWRERRSTMIMVTHDVDEAIYLSDRVVVMSPRPAKIETILPVELPRPRGRSSQDFLQLRAKILTILNYGGQQLEPNYYI
ncbi:MAG: ABC transporter ATP-binding protein [Deltaproteobacteria bacterium]|jgi:NitT/TauT family transport system ATP-binding protein/sulfonate transport system ATP-binding protein|nr:ABC transporter ATP-binding protein [Deltaproteobacteria bacterium]